MWPRRAVISPMRGPPGSPPRATEPSEAGSGACPSPTLASSIRTSPSMTRANSSWAQVRHSEVPSARMASSTYWRVLPAATFSDGGLVVGPGPRGGIEDVGEGVVVGLVVDDLDVALLIRVQRAEPGREAGQADHSLRSDGCSRNNISSKHNRTSGR